MTKKDSRLYGKFTLDFGDNYKIMPLSSDAFRCLVEATLWSRREMTDGFLPRRYAVAKWGLESLTELSENDDEAPSLEVVDGGWQIRDFAEHQDTKAEIEARTKQNKLNGQKGGRAKAAAAAKRVAKPASTESLAETETEKEITHSVSNDFFLSGTDENETPVTSPVVDAVADEKSDPDHGELEVVEAELIPVEDVVSSSLAPTDTTTTAPAEATTDRADVLRICEHLQQRIQANGSKKPAITRQWIDEARRLIDRDGRSEDQIHSIIEWCQNDMFWKSNILSMPKLRKQFDQLALKMNTQGHSYTMNRDDVALNDLRSIQWG